MDSPRVFISYSHDSREHAERVLTLANRLRAEGIDARLDQYEAAPPQGWPRWMVDEIDHADYILVVASPQYQARFQGRHGSGRRGVAWEGAVITQDLYEASLRNRLFIPVVFSREDIDSIPIVLRASTFYDLSREQDYEGLYRRLTGQPKVATPALGRRRALPPRERKTVPEVPVVWTVPHPRNPSFVDHERTLAALTAVCEKAEDNVLHVVTGPAGVGKTALLVELAYRVRSAFQVVLWLRSDGESGLISSMAEAAAALGLSLTESQTETEIEEKLVRWLEANKHWLLIFDDVVDFKRIERITRRVGRHGIFFAASRSRTWSSLAKDYPLGPLPLAASLSLLTSRNRPRNADEREAGVEIAEMLDGLPLAVCLAADQIEGRGISYTEYRDSFVTLSDYLKRFSPGDLSPSSCGLLLPALEELAGLDLKLLQATSCFASGTAVPLRLLTEAIETLPDADAVSALDRMATRGWIRLDGEGEKVFGHPVVLGYLRQRRWDPGVAAGAEEALRRAAAHATASGRASADLICHLRFVVDDDGTRQDLRFSHLAYELAEQLWLADRAAEAVPYLEKALEIREGGGRRDSTTARIHSRLAEAAGKRGSLQEAVDARDFCDLVPWGEEMFARLGQDGFAATNLRTVGAGRWLIRVRIPSELQEAYGTAPEVLLLAAQGEVQGADLRRAQEDLELHRFELDLDLLVVIDERPALPKRLDLMYQTEGQWVPWSRDEKGFPPLSAAFREFLPAQDIFAQRDAVRGRQIIGRGAVISSLLRSIRRGQTVGIFGLRKIGKTTVARAVTDRLDPISALVSLPLRSRGEVEPSEALLRVAWLDAGRFHERTLETVAGRLLKALNDRLEAEPPAGALSGDGGGLAALDRRLDEILKASAIPIVFVIDEFDLLFEGSGGQPPVPDLEKLFQVLRGHAQETGRLVLMLVGRDPSFLEAPEMGGRTNPMLGWLVPRWLGPMDPEDADLLLEKLGRRVGLDVDAKPRELARLWTGGHPRLHRELGSALLEVARGSAAGRRRFLAGHVPVDDLFDQALERFLERHDVLTICREVFHLLGEKYSAAAELLAELAGLEGAERGRVLASRGGWQRPENRVLRDFGLVQGSSKRPDIPRFLSWYLHTFEPRLRRRAFAPGLRRQA